MTDRPHRWTLRHTFGAPAATTRRRRFNLRMLSAAGAEIVESRVLLSATGNSDDHANVPGPDATVVELPAGDPAVAHFTGELTADDPADVFRIELPGAKHVRFDSFGPQMVSAEGNQPGYVDAQTWLLSQGTWYVVIAPTPELSTGTFDFAAEFTDAIPDDHADKAGSDSTQVFVDETNSTVTVSGRLSHVNDHDTFQLMIPYPVRLVRDGTRQFSPSLQVLDSNGRPTGENGGPGVPGSEFLFDVTGPLVWIDVSGNPGKPSGDYEIRLRLDEHPDLPALSAPVELISGIGATIDPSPLLTWKGVPDAVDYEVYISESGTSRPLFRQSGIAATQFQVPIELPHGDYTVWVRAHRGPDRMSLWGDGFSMSVGAAPRLTKFGHDGVLAWESVPGADKYEVWIGERADSHQGIRQVLLESTTATLFVIPAAVSRGSYEVWVRAVHQVSGGSRTASGWSRPAAFQLADPVPAPVIDDWNITAVTYGSTVEGDGILPGDPVPPALYTEQVFLTIGPMIRLPAAPLTWYGIVSTAPHVRIIDARTGDVLVQDRMMSGPATNVVGGSSSWLELLPEDVQALQGRELAVQARVTGFLPYQDPVFRPLPWVIPTLRTRSSDWSAPFEFHMDAADLTVESSPGYPGNAPLLNWAAVPNRSTVMTHFLPDPPTEGSPPAGFVTRDEPAVFIPPVWPKHEQRMNPVHYEVWIGDVRTKQRVVHDTGVTATRYQVPDSLTAGVYVAWVRGVYENGTAAPWSPAHQFMIQAAPVRITGPDSTVDATPVITWKPVPQASSYEVWVQRDGSGSPAWRQVGISTAHHRVPVALPPGNYTVWVRAHLTNGAWSRWGGGTPLEIGVPPIVRVTNDVVTWRPVQDATRYELWVDRIGESGRTLQQRTIHETRLFSTAWSASGLDGTFRIWVRAIRDESGQTYQSRWSEAVDVRFTPATGADGYLTALWNEADDHDLFSVLQA